MRTATKSDRYVTSVNSVSLKSHLKPLIIPYASNTINHPTELSPIYSPYEVFFIPNQSKSDPPTYSTIVITKPVSYYILCTYDREIEARKRREKPPEGTQIRAFSNPRTPHRSRRGIRSTTGHISPPLNHSAPTDNTGARRPGPNNFNHRPRINFPRPKHVINHTKPCHSTRD